MILFKSFVEAIYQAISEATDVLCEKNRQILDKYFYEYPNDDNGISEEKTLHPKTISLDYPVLNDEGTVVKCNIQVPLISLVPITATQIEKATFTAEFQLSIENDELLIDFPNAKRRRRENSTIGKLEVVISPQEPTEGMHQIISAYENTLKRQISD